MTNENLIHIKFEYEEGLQTKKDMLSSELGILRIAKAIKKYQSSRIQELKVKINLSKKIKELKLNLTKLQKVLPKIKIPELREEKTEIKKRIESSTKTKSDGYDDLEFELKEIREQLKSLGS